MTGLFASFIVIRCPGCGKAVPTGGMKFGKEPDLYLVECENCLTKFEVFRDPVSGHLKTRKPRRN